MDYLSRKDSASAFFKNALAFSDLDGNLTYVDNSFVTMWGYDDASEILGKNAVMFLHERKSALRAMEEVRKKGQYTDTLVAVRKDGAKFDVQFSACLIMDGSGKPVSIIGSFLDVSKHKSAEEAIRLERNNLINILNSMKDGVYIVNQQNDIEYVNAALQKEFGSPEGRKCYEYFHDQKTVCSRCKNKDVFAGKTVRWKLHFLKNQKTYNLIDTPIKNPDGSISKLGIFHDITKQVQIEVDLKKRTHDLNERVKELNCLYCISKIVGETDSSLKDMLQKIIALIPSSWQYPEITCARITLGDQVFKTNGFRNTSWKQVSKIVASDNLVVTLEVCYLEERPEMDEGPFLTEERDLIEAITKRLGKIIERKRMDKLLKESESKFRSVFENAGSAIFLANADTGMILDCNRRAEDLIGRKRNAIIGLHQSMLHPKGEEEKYKKIFTKHITQGRSHDYEGDVQHADGRRIPVFIGAQTMKIKDESITMGIFIDISERKHAEEKLEDSAKRLEELNTALRVLLMKREEDKTSLEERVLLNVKKLILPSVERLKRASLSAKQEGYLDILEGNLKNITSTFIQTLSSQYLGLSPNEIHIADFVREGKTTKEIAELLNLSTRTIESHRDHIRRKFGIKNKKRNLRSHLLSLQ